MWVLSKISGARLVETAVVGEEAAEARWNCFGASSAG